MTRRPWSRLDWLANAAAIVAMGVVLYGMWLVTP